MPTQAFPRLEHEDLLLLLRPFTGEDIHRVVHDMKPFQAPGPDGFQIIFYQRAWQVVGKAFIDMAINFFSTGMLLDKVVESTVVLIPKVEHLEMVTHLRPISLNNVCLKPITKAITNCLKPIMRKLVSPRQSSFIPQGKLLTTTLFCRKFCTLLERKRQKRGCMDQLHHVLRGEQQDATSVEWKALSPDNSYQRRPPGRPPFTLSFCVVH
ncbi:unnamed protein product [Linum trigynum]|uniref:Reverse transcriptase n=1 Tax=Linum trigynum TaxID=586398 RepID=A0AAV2G831_9ROSI